MFCSVLVLIVCVLWSCWGDNVIKTRGALLVTLAGDHELKGYFEWSCRTIGASKGMFDMLVFHESNVRVMALNCSSNVKLIDVGTGGFSKLIIAKLSEISNYNETTREKMTIQLNDIIVHSPRYMIEVKPMLGSLFQRYLSSYSHWSFTDPDIMWGNLTHWIEAGDLNRFDIVTMTQYMDAGRLFIRGQVHFKDCMTFLCEL